MVALLTGYAPAVSTLPTPWAFAAKAVLGIPEEAVIAVPAFGLDLYRLVGPGEPSAGDFRPISKGLALKREIPELLRLGLSHYLSAEQAETWRTKPDSQIARVVVDPNPRVHVARTDRDRNGHVEVWAPADVIETLLTAAEIVA